jgi:hypothetical protein
MEETAQNVEKRFFKTDLIFSMSFQNFMSHIEFMKFCQNHWSLVSMDNAGSLLTLNFFLAFNSHSVFNNFLCFSGFFSLIAISSF